MDTDLNAHNDEQLQQEEVDDSCRLQFTEIVPLTTDTQCVSGGLLMPSKRTFQLWNRNPVMYVCYLC